MKVCSSDIAAVITYIFYFQYFAHEVYTNLMFNYKDKNFQLEEEYELIYISKMNTNIPLIVTLVL